MTIIDLIRHGEPEGGRAYRGHNIDDPLSEKGWQQMWSAVGTKAPWSQIISSPLIRCRHFAEMLAEKFSLPVSIDDRFKEVGFGRWEGRTPDMIKAENLTQYNAFYADPVNARPPGAENLITFTNRVSSAYIQAVNDHANQHILIVAHAGVIRAAIAHALQAPPLSMYHIKVHNAGITRIRHTQQGAMLELHNHSFASPSSQD